MLTQVLSVHIVRTAKTPILESRASRFVTLMGLAAALLAFIVPNSPIGTGLGFAPTPVSFLPWLAALCAGYVVLSLLARAHYLATNATARGRDGA